jgi:uncharacterized membrane protein HdeD (DUF308 family)
VTSIQGISQTATTPLIRRWWLVAGLGVALVVIGILLLANLAEAAFTIAILLGIGFVVAGVDEFVEADRHRARWPSYVLGTLWIVTGVAAMVWPDITLWALAFTVGIGLIAVGLAETFFVVYYRRSLPLWGVWLLDGLLSVVVGVMALIWPEATVIVLAILFGVRVLMRGVWTIMFGFGLRRIHQTTQRANV